MKQKISVSMDEQVVKTMEDILKEGRFRNKSHIVEYAVNKLLRDEE